MGSSQSREKQITAEAPTMKPNLEERVGRESAKFIVNNVVKPVAKIYAETIPNFGLVGGKWKIPGRSRSEHSAWKSKTREWTMIRTRTGHEDDDYSGIDRSHHAIAFRYTSELTERRGKQQHRWLKADLIYQRVYAAGGGHESQTVLQFAGPHKHEEGEELLDCSSWQRVDNEQGVVVTASISSLEEVIKTTYDEFYAYNKFAENCQQFAYEVTQNIMREFVVPATKEGEARLQQHAAAAKEQQHAAAAKEAVWLYEMVHLLDTECKQLPGDEGGDEGDVVGFELAHEGTWEAARDAATQAYQQNVRHEQLKRFEPPAADPPATVSVQFRGMLGGRVRRVFFAELDAVLDLMLIISFAAGHGYPPATHDVLVPWPRRVFDVPTWVLTLREAGLGGREIIQVEKRCMSGRL